ncbi:50S ribosomal protein L21 [Croceicoccus marinus]|nr:50S ribosomal protein L21 [Croceicoccus marinus]
MELTGWAIASNGHRSIRHFKCFCALQSHWAGETSADRHGYNAGALTPGRGFAAEQTGFNMFAIVRTGGKQYRVAEGDKIAVEKLAGDAGDKIELGDILLAGEGSELKDASKVKVSAEIIAQAKSEKVIVFKKRRRHNYRRRNGHRQQMTLLRIVSVG